MKLTQKQAQLKHKFGAKLRVYKINKKEFGIVYIGVKKGHFEEFYNKKSTFIYYVIEGTGAFYLNGKKIPVKATNLIVIPPMTKIYYLGKMKMTLTTIPAWNAKNEVHVRFIKESVK